MFTVQTFLQALNSKDICLALQDITAEDIHFLKQNGLSVLHMVLEALANQIFVQMDAQYELNKDKKPEDSWVPKADHIALLTKIIKADPAAMGAEFYGKSVLQCLKKTSNTIPLFRGKRTNYASSLASFMFSNGVEMDEYSPWNSWAHHCQIEYQVHFDLLQLKAAAKKKMITKLHIPQLLHHAELSKELAILNAASKKKLQDVINFIYTSELTVIMLQVIPQVDTLLPETFLYIIGIMLGISYQETNKLYVQMIKTHAKNLQVWGLHNALTLFKAKVGSTVLIEEVSEVKLDS